MAIKRLVTVEVHRNSFVIKSFKCGVYNMLEKSKMLDSSSSFMARSVENIISHFLKKIKSKQNYSIQLQENSESVFIVEQNQFSPIFKISSRAFNNVPYSTN